MLTIAAVGMVLYGSSTVLVVAVSILRGTELEFWAEAGSVVCGLLLVLSAAFVRVRLPGGLALAIGAMLGLQALAVHTAAHVGSGLAPQLGRAAVAAGLTALAYFAGDDRPGSRR